MSQPQPTYDFNNQKPLTTRTMKKVLLTLTIAALITFTLKAQDSISTPLSISGSVDTYWKYDFAKIANILTSFASDYNSASLGMIDVAFKKTTGRASFVTWEERVSILNAYTNN